ncbi:MAG: hypothetical protein ABI868_21050 [Acidobacteriota bacterium]
MGVVLTLGGIARHTAVRAAPGNGVKIMPNGRAPDDNPGERGATYYALEAQTSRFTTRFHDGTTAVAERTADGDIETKLRDLGGNEINRFKVGHDKLMYLRPSATPVQAVPDSGVHATFDWSNRQSHRLFEDGVASGAGLEWRDGLMRHTSARGKDEEAAVVREVETRWAHGLSARTARVRARRGDVFDGKPLQGDVLATILMRDGVEVGLANYLTYERVFVWTIPGMSEGSIGNDHLKQQFNGWPFTPDMVWMNLQTIALYHWKETITQKGFVARCDQPQPNPLVQFFVPTVSANEVGCDGLHWLDHTVMRYCCDSHDNCYERDGCAYKSWWMFWSSWRCDFCNILAIRCFQTGAIPTGKIRRPPAAPVDY